MQERRSGWMLGVVWLIAVAYVFHHIRDNFYDVDEGMLAHIADRVMHGQLPQRDFIDPYTGALGMLYAVAFRVVGETFMATRWVLLAATACWVPVFYALARRIARPLAAGLAVILAIAWSVPQHPRGMPSWYALFLATAGAAALLRYTDTKRRRWLVAAGVAAGTSCIIKIVGLYFIAAAWLFFIYQEQDSDRISDAPAAANWYTILIGLGVIGYAVAVAWLVRSQGVRALVHYALPNAAAAALLVARERSATYAPPTRRLVALVDLMGPFAAGLAFPVLAFLVPYIASGSLHALLVAVFVEPMRRFSVIAYPPPPALSVLMAVPVVVALGLVGRQSARAWTVSVVAVALVAASGAYIGADPNFNTPPHILATMLRQACYGLIPVLVIIAAVMLRRRRGQPTLALFTFVLASGTLIQFPTALDQYFLYVAPLVVLVALALVVDRTTQQPRPRGIAAGVAALFLVWAVGRTEFSPVYHRRTARLNVPRGGPLVEWFMVPMYQKLVALVDAHARGRYIYAGPDSPHVYFLTGKQNPTPTIYEVFDDRPDPTDSVLRQIDTLGVTAVVINRHRNVSGPMDQRLEAALTARFANVDSAGAYLVRWR